MSSQVRPGDLVLVPAEGRLPRAVRPAPRSLGLVARWLSPEILAPIPGQKHRAREVAREAPAALQQR